MRPSSRSLSAGGRLGAAGARSARLGDPGSTEMILTDVSDTIHADSLALFALNIEILLADVTKPEKSKILTLT